MATVKVRLNDREAQAGRVFWERHTEHPEGEIFLSGEGEWEIGATPFVLASIRRGRLVEITAEPAKKTHDDEKPPGTPDEPKLTAAAAKLAAEYPDLDLKAIHGSGADGAITKADIEAALTISA